MTSDHYATEAKGRGLETRWGEILNLPNASGRTRPWGLADCLDNVGSSTSDNPTGLHGLLRE
jgi:hypothetical protein